MADWRIPLSDLSYDEAEERALLEVLRSRWVSSGPRLAAFELEFAAATGSTEAIGVASATAALHLGLLALGLGPGDEVIQPALNFVAAANMTRAAGATAVFADIDSVERPWISAENVESRLTEHTRAVVVMHYAGVPAPTADLVELCRQHDLFLIEDAAHALGTTYGPAAPDDWADRPIGGLGDVACFSFFGNKNLATGEGGMVTTEDPEVAKRLRLLRSHGMTSASWDRYSGHASFYDVASLGFNYRMDDLHAAIGQVQLGKLPHNNERRREHLRAYREAFADVADWTVVPTGDYPTAGHLMVALAPDRRSRDDARAALHDAGIQTSMHYPSITGFASYADSASPVPATLEFSERALTLPLYADLPTAAPAEIASIVRAV